ncbi:MAG: Stp1/IreP family PP2C-type Ser/Thr phosphatase, partial [Streptosporangiaceae bacterium]
LSLHVVRAGNRHLLCTDGRHGVGAEPNLRAALVTAAGPAAAAGLIALATAAGAPDNVACAVADVIAL